MLAQLSRETDFYRAAEALKTALSYGAKDTDSILATFTRLNSQVLELDPLVLPRNVPRMPPFQARVDHYDRLFLKGGKTREAADR
jgi:hypothetical protein